ncbi:MAG: hypothetical protein JSR77_02820 [Planctomycetes bacterium]|nr:hypothetical protein [Planctomycetota bacterium]
MQQTSVTGSAMGSDNLEVAPVIGRTATSGRVYPITAVFLVVFVVAVFAGSLLSRQSARSVWYDLIATPIVVLFLCTVVYYLGRRSWKAANFTACVLLGVAGAERVLWSGMVNNVLLPARVAAAAPKAGGVMLGLAELDAATSEFADRMNPLNAELDAALQEFTKTGGLVTPAADIAGVVARRAAAKRVVSAAEMYEQFVADAPLKIREAALAAHPEAAGVDPMAFTRQMRAIRHDSMLAYAKAQTQSARALEDVIKVLEDCKGAWTVSDGNQYVFDTRETMGAFNAALEALDQATRRESQARGELAGAPKK